MKKQKELWEMTFEEFNKSVIFYEYKSRYGGIYQYVCIGAKNNENFKYHVEDVKEIKSRVRGFFTLDKEYQNTIKQMERHSIYFGHFGRTFKSRIDCVEKAYHKMKITHTIEVLKEITQSA